MCDGCIARGLIDNVFRNKINFILRLKYEGCLRLRRPYGCKFFVFFCTGILSSVLRSLLES